MAWEEFDGYKKEMGGSPKISIYFSTFALNGNFVKLANLELPCYVVVYIDEKKKRIGFKFHKEQKKNSFKVSPYKNRKGAQFTNTQIKKGYSWVNKLIDKSANVRNFSVKKEKDMYFIEIKGGIK
jgi:hypothetical protein